MPSKTKKTKKTNQPDHSCVPSDVRAESLFGEAFAKREAEREAQRAKEKELVMAAGAALIAMAAEQRLTFIAQRFESLAAAAKDLTTLGVFPAIEQVRGQIINELVVMGRDLHESRVARVQG